MIIEYKGQRPQIADNVYIAPNATIIGDVVIGEGSSVWFGAVIRGDTGQIRIGTGVSVQDNCVIHVNEHDNTIIGNEIVIGHGAILEGCVIGDGVLIGMNATVLSGARVGEQAVIAAGAVVRERFEVPAKTLTAGVPAKPLRELTPDMLERIASGAAHYRVKAQEFKTETAVISD